MATRGSILPGPIVASVGLILALTGCSTATSQPVPAPDSGTPTVPASPSEVSPSASPSRSTSPAPVSRELLSARDIAAFEREFGSEAGVAVAGFDGGESVASPVTGVPYAWSTIKPVIVAQTLLDAGGPSGLTAQQRDLVRRALSASDNEAAAALHEQIMARHGGLHGAAEVMQRLLRRAGDERTEISTQGRADFSTYGQTRWLPGDQVRFVASLAQGCLLDESSTDYLLGELGQVVPDQRWGFGLVSAPAFKGGWGPDPDGRYLVRQFAVVRAADGREFAAAILDRPGDGSFETGKASLGRMATWLSPRVTTAPARTACS